MVEIIKDTIIKKEVGEEVDAYEQQLRSKYIRLMN